MTKSRTLIGVLAVAGWGALCFVAGLGVLGGMSTAREPAPKVRALLSTGQTVIGQPIAYPRETPKVTAVLITMQPGQSTGWHQHDVPLFGYMLDGEITVDYGPVHGKKVYRKGDSLMEAIRAPHDGTATSPGPASILAVFIGADGVKNSETVASPY